MIVVEEQHDKEPERNSDKYPFHLESPKVDQPTPRLGWMECFCDWESANIRIFQSPGNMCEPYSKHGPNLCHGVVSLKFPLHVSDY